MVGKLGLQPRHTGDGTGEAALQIGETLANDAGEVHRGIPLDPKANRHKGDKSHYQEETLGQYPLSAILIGKRRGFSILSDLIAVGPVAADGCVLPIRADSCQSRAR